MLANKLKMWTRTTLALATVLVLMLVLGIGNILTVKSLSSAMVAFEDEVAESSLQFTGYMKNYLRGWMATASAAGSKQSERQNHWLGRAKDRFGEARDALRKMDELIKDPAVRERFATVNKDATALLSSVEKAWEGIRSGQGESVWTDMTSGQLYANRRALILEEDALNEALQQAATHYRASSVAAGRNSTLFSQALMAAALLFTLVIAWHLKRNTARTLVGLQEETERLISSAVEGKLSVRADSDRVHFEFAAIATGFNRMLDAIMAPIEEASAVLERLSRRDLEARMAGNYQGDHARIKDAVNQTAAALNESLSQVASAVDQVSAAAGEIASSSQTVADGASQQASSLEETSSALESMSAMSKRTADNASQANALAQTAKGAATSGSESVVHMSSAMAKIKASAEGTSQIIKDINEIAFQTNLLALNAAVEAARAGEAGRGFAVVAEEVRSLALRSKEAAMKTEELIRESVRQAGEGESMSADVSEKLNEILQGIERVNGIVNEISASAKEQASGVDQINRAVADMNKVTQQNAANSEESSSAAAELSSQSEELAAMVSSFKLSRSSGSSRTRSRAPSPALRPKPPIAAGHAHVPSAKPATLIPLDADPDFRDF